VAAEPGLADGGLADLVGSIAARSASRMAKSASRPVLIEPATDSRPFVRALPEV
jgi:hypothetical protein